MSNLQPGKSGYSVSSPASSPSFPSSSFSLSASSLSRLCNEDDMDSIRHSLSSSDDLSGGEGGAGGGGGGGGSGSGCEGEGSCGGGGGGGGRGGCAGGMSGRGTMGGEVEEEGSLNIPTTLTNVEFFPSAGIETKTCSSTIVEVAEKNYCGKFANENEFVKNEPNLTQNHKNESSRNEQMSRPSGMIDDIVESTAKMYLAIPPPPPPPTTCRPSSNFVKTMIPAVATFGSFRPNCSDCKPIFEDRGPTSKIQKRISLSNVSPPDFSDNCALFFSQLSNHKNETQDLLLRKNKETKSQLWSVTNSGESNCVNPASLSNCVNDNDAPSSDCINPVPLTTQSIRFAPISPVNFRPIAHDPVMPTATNSSPHPKYSVQQKLIDNMTSVKEHKSQKMPETDSEPTIESTSIDPTDHSQPTIVGEKLAVIKEKTKSVEYRFLH